MTHEHERDPFDQFAALFLTEPDAPQEPGAPIASAVELLMVGHLPVRGGLWLTPYVDMLARQIGPATLVRLDADEPSVQLLRGPSAAERLFEGTEMKPLIEQLAAHTRLWVVRPPGDTTTEALLRCGVDRITLLTSADQVAVTAAYQLVKNLVDVAEEHDIPVPVIGVAVIGADEHAAAAMVERLNRTCQSFLGIELPLIATLPRMDGQMRSTGRAQLAGEQTPALTELVNWISLGRSLAAEAGEAAPVEPAESPAAVPAPPIDAWDVVPQPPVPAPPPSRQPAAGLHEAGEPVAPASDYIAQGRPDAVRTVPFKLAPKPIVDVEPKAPAHVTEPDDAGQPVPLARYVEGLTPLTIRMPDHESVELAHDSEGRLQLLCGEESLREITTVRSWSWAHREILQMAVPRLRITHPESLIAHVFTAVPLNVSDLHGSDLHLHLLTPVSVGAHTAWYSTPLYAPARLPVR